MPALLTRRPGWRRAALALLLASLLLQAAPAAARSFHISNFHSTINVAEDGSATVIERITLVFLGSWNGIYRTIPIDYPGPGGTNYTLFLDVLGVQDAEGHKLRHKLSRDGAYREIQIWIPGANDAERTIELTYRVRNPIRFFDTHDELYWNVTGNDWQVPIDHASAWVFLPPAAAEGMRAQAFTGVYGSAQRDAGADVQGSSARFETTNPLPMRGGLTVNVFIPKGVLREPGALTRAWWFFSSHPILLLPLLAFAVMFSLWYWKGRDPDPGVSVAPQYEPPKDMTPAEAGALVDDRVDPRDITSTLVDLAVRGYLRIEETKEKQFLFTKRDYVIHMVRPRGEWQQLAAHERIMLEKIFAGGGTQTRLSSLREQFYTALPSIRHDVIGALRRKGMYHLDPTSANGYRLLAALAIAAPFVLAQFFGWASFFLSPLVAVASIAAALLIVWLFGRHLTAKTLRGMRTYTHIRGLQEFMTRVEADRLRRMPSDTFEKFLPFAMALGVEERWARAFEGIVQQPPRWYSGVGAPGFNTLRFTHALQTMSRTAHSTFVAAPRSSSSGSGFGRGGGGFSGGGFGGGGGRGF